MYEIEEFLQEEEQEEKNKEEIYKVKHLQNSDGYLHLLLENTKEESDKFLQENHPTEVEKARMAVKLMQQQEQAVQEANVYKEAINAYPVQLIVLGGLGMFFFWFYDLQIQAYFRRYLWVRLGFGVALGGFFSNPFAINWAWLCKMGRKAMSYIKFWKR